MPRKYLTKNRTPDYEKRIVRALRQLTQKLDEHSRRLLTDYDVTMPQVICLDELNDKGVMTVSVLAHTIHLSPSTTVGIIDRLEKKAFVTRTRDIIDRRSVFIEITEKGRDFILKTPHLLHNKLHGNLMKVQESEKIQIANSLDLLLQLMDRKAAKPKDKESSQP